MNVAVIKTKAETALLEDFEAVSARLPGNAAVGQMRRDAIGRFAALGLPGRRMEAWKYTDLRALLKDSPPLATGDYSIAQYGIVEEALYRSLKGEDQGGDWSMIADGKQITANGKLAGVASTLTSVLMSPPAWVTAELTRSGESSSDGVFALNTAFMTDGVVLDVPDGADWTEPVHIMFCAAGGGKTENHRDPRRVVTRNIIRVGKNAKVTLVENHQGDAAMPRHSNSVTQIIAGDGAEVTHVKFADPAAGETHLANWIVRLGANTTYRPFQMTSGEGMVRNELNVVFEGQHSSIDLGALALARAAGHADTTMVIDHAVPHCTSREIYKCVLDGRARAVFQGKVVVRPDAQKTDGKQMARALLLSPDAEFNSKPELEIYADNVVCGHGTTSIELDEDLLFYCQSRGIPTAEARALLIESFIGEVIDKVENEDLRAALTGKASAWLNETTA